MDKTWCNSSYNDCYINLKCEEDEDLNCQLKLYKPKKDNLWRVVGSSDSVEISSLRGLSDFDVFIMVLERSFANIEMDTESEYTDEIEPEEKPEWSLS